MSRAKRVSGNFLRAAHAQAGKRTRQHFYETFLKDVSRQTRFGQLFLEGFWRDVSRETRIWQLLLAVAGGRLGGWAGGVQRGGT